MELQAELTGRDGLKQTLRVRCEPHGELRDLLAGLSQLREEVALLLGPLVKQESAAATGDRIEPGGDDEDEQEDDEEEKHTNAKTYTNAPPLKRTKPNS